MKRQCGWCGKPLNDQNDGVEITLTPGVNDVAHEMGLDPDEPITHGICNDCARDELASVGITDLRATELIERWRVVGSDGTLGLCQKPAHGLRRKAYGNGKHRKISKRAGILQV